jgi:hypothetical protein
MELLIWASLVTLPLLAIFYILELLNKPAAKTVTERTWLTRAYSSEEALHLHYHLRIYHSIHPLQRRHMHDLGFKHEITQHMSEAGVVIHIPSGDWASMIRYWLSIADLDDQTRQTYFTRAIIANNTTVNA